MSWIELLHEIAERADALSLARFRAHDLRVDSKPDRTLVTEADLAVEEAARELVARRQPELGVFGEEHGEQGNPELRLIIDPIDGTSNFARGIPVYATLLALEERGEIVAGLVSAPALGTRWWATRGGGAVRDGRPVRVSAVRELDAAQLFYGGIGGYEAHGPTDAIIGFVRGAWRQRGFGDFWQHCLVAEGAGEVGIDPIVAPWDVAPLMLLVEEAGGRATSLGGEASIYAGSLVTSNGLLHDRALAALRS